MTATRIDTYYQDRLLSNATGIFFENNKRLFVVSSRHTFIDEPSQHTPDEIRIQLHTDADNLAEWTAFSIPLYKDRLSQWRDATDSAGTVDVAAIEVDHDALPKTAVYRPYTLKHLLTSDEEVEIGSTLLVIGYPLGFQDLLHQLPVVRQAGLASSFGLRFQGKGYFLTDARTHRGISGGAVVMRAPEKSRKFGNLPWRLLGIHSARMDMTRDVEVDEALGLNCAWYADILTTLTSD